MALAACAPTTGAAQLHSHACPHSAPSLFVELVDRLALLDAVKDGALDSLAAEAGAAQAAAAGGEGVCGLDELLAAQVGAPRSRQLPAAGAASCVCMPPLRMPLHGTTNAKLTRFYAIHPPPHTPGPARAAGGDHQRSARGAVRRRWRPRAARLPRKARAGSRVLRHRLCLLLLVVRRGLLIGRGRGAGRDRAGGGGPAAAAGCGARDEPGGARGCARAAAAARLLPRQRGARAGAGSAAMRCAARLQAVMPGRVL